MNEVMPTLVVSEANVQANPIVVTVPDFTKTKLEDVVLTLLSEQRRFILFRIVGMKVEKALISSKCNQGNYNSWVARDEYFRQVNSWVGALSRTHRQEAIVLLRRENQLTAVMLEEEVINRLMEEIQSGEYVLMKLPIAKEVYNKLIAVLDAMPVVNIKNMNFLDRAKQVQEIINRQPSIEGEFSEVSTNNGSASGNTPATVEQREQVSPDGVSPAHRQQAGDSSTVQSNPTPTPLSAE